MAHQDHVPLDRLTHKHEFFGYDPTDPELTQVLAVEHAGRALEVIVPLFYDGTRIGEVVAAAADGEVVFVLCRNDRPFDDDRGTLGLLVVAVPHRDGRQRAAIAHSTYSLEGSGKRVGLGLGLYPVPRPAGQAGAAGDKTGPGAERTGRIAEALLRARRADPFTPFCLRLTDGRTIPVARPDCLGWDGRARTVVVFGEEGGLSLIDLGHIVAIGIEGESAAMS